MTPQLQDVTPSSTLATRNENMNRITPPLIRVRIIALWVALLALMTAGSNPLFAQTLEGVTITNTATASYTDANGNVYTNATGSVSVTVGFLGSLAVSSPAATAPNSPSTGDAITWTITNNGNGNDQIQVAVTSSNTNVAGNLRYVYSGTSYASLAALNTRLAAVGDSVPRLGSITIDVVHDVLAGQGGNSSNVQLTATSTRAGGDSNNSTTVATAILGGTLTVTSDNATRDRLPSNGTLYVETFRVASGLSGTADVDLTVSIQGVNDATVVFTGIRVQGAPIWEVPLTTTVPFTAGQSETIEVQYRVDGLVADAGSSSTVRLTATASAVPGLPTDFDETVVTIVTPSLTVTKSVYSSLANAQAGAPALTGRPIPGATIWYRVQVTNNGTATAVLSGGSYGLTDNLSALPVTYVGGSLNQTGSPLAWSSLGEAAGVISGTIAGGLPGGGGTAWFVFAVTID